MSRLVCRDSSVGSERLTVDQEATGSSPVPGIIFSLPDVKAKTRRRTCE